MKSFKIIEKRFFIGNRKYDDRLIILGWIYDGNPEYLWHRHNWSRNYNYSERQSP